MTSLKTFNNFTDHNFFFEIQSNGCVVPTVYNRNFVPIKKYILNKQDIFKDSLWQKANKKVISNKDEESAKKFTKRYKLF